jgi:hypothetical protein
MEKLTIYTEPGPKAWGIVFFLLFWASVCVVKRVANGCLAAQRSRLRDDYENELRRGGKMTNRLLLPAAPNTAWNLQSAQP